MDRLKEGAYQDNALQQAPNTPRSGPLNFSVGFLKSVGTVMKNVLKLLQSMIAMIQLGNAHSIHSRANFYGASHSALIQILSYQPLQGLGRALGFEAVISRCQSIILTRIILRRVLRAEHFQGG